MAQQNTLEGFNASAARVGMTGAVRHAALGEAPVPMGTKYDTTKHKNYGYLAPDGLEISFDEDKQEYIPWQEVNAIRTDITKAVKAIKFTLWETTIENIAAFLGVPVSDIKEDEKGNFSFYEGALPNFPHEWLSLDVVDGDKAMRLTLLDAKITERGSMVFKKDEMFGLEVTYNTFPAGEDYESIDGARGKTAHWQFNSDWANGTDTASSSTTDGVTPLSFTTAADLGSSSTTVSETVAATGGTEPYTYSVAAGALPTGVELDGATGAITGTAETTGEFTFTIKVTDGKSLSASREFTLNVA